MLEQLNNYDWEEAFKYVSDIDTSETDCSKEAFTREDVTKIYDIVEGENDGDPWRVYGKLRDGRYFYLEAWCDYTGWGCQEGGHTSVNTTKARLISHGLTEEARRVFGLIEDNVGTINVKPANEEGFRKITFDRSIEKGTKKNKKKEKVKVVKINGSISSLEL